MLVVETIAEIRRDYFVGKKSIKAIAGIEFTYRRPRSSWERAIPSEYGFYANVNPEVDHPRWSQATERPIGAGLFAGRKPTLMFNGYAEQVAHLYDGGAGRTVQPGAV